MSRQKISRSFAPCAAQSLRRFLISLSKRYPLLSCPLPQDAAQTSRRRRQNPFVLRQTFFTAFAAAGDRLNLPNSRTSEVTYGLVSLMELLHCGMPVPLGCRPTELPDLVPRSEANLLLPGFACRQNVGTPHLRQLRSPESPKLQKIEVTYGLYFAETRCALRRSPRSLFSLPAFLPPIISQSFRAWSKVCSMCF